MRQLNVFVGKGTAACFQCNNVTPFVIFPFIPNTSKQKGPIDKDTVIKNPWEHPWLAFCGAPGRHVGS